MSRKAWTKKLAARGDIKTTQRSAAPAPVRNAPRSARSKQPRSGEMMLQEIALAATTDQDMPPRQVYPMALVPKPRMSQRDRWSPRPCVLRYRACCDELRLRGARLPHRYVLIVVVAMPRSWSKRKRCELENQPCLQKPDMSNYLKTIEDALVPNDERLWSVKGIKIWGTAPAVIILRAGDTPQTDAQLLEQALSG